MLGETYRIPSTVYPIPDGAWGKTITLIVAEWQIIVKFWSCEY